MSGLTRRGFLSGAGAEMLGAAAKFADGEPAQRAAREAPGSAVVGASGKGSRRNIVMMDALERTNHVQNTALLAFSDHGDYAGDYGLGEKWAGSLEESLTHVPMIARVPGGVSGHTGSHQTELFNVMQTSLELAGTSARHTHFSRSLLLQIFGGSGDPQRAAFSECGYNVYEPQCFVQAGEGGGSGGSRNGSETSAGEAPASSAARASATSSPVKLEPAEPELISRAACVKTNEYKFVSRPQGQSELYLYKDDAKELHNRFGEVGVERIQAEAQQRLLHWYVNTTGIAPWDRDQRTFPPYLPSRVGEHESHSILDQSWVSGNS